MWSSFYSTVWVGRELSRSTGVYYVTIGPRAIPTSVPGVGSFSVRSTFAAMDFYFVFLPPLSLPVLSRVL